MSRTPAENIVLRPLVTEKTLRMAERDRAYTFQVLLAANKVQIRDAIEELFKVKVTGVRTSTYLGKGRRMGRYFGTTPTWKRAVVSVKEGDTIDFY